MKKLGVLVFALAGALSMSACVEVEEVGPDDPIDPPGDVDDGAPGVSFLNPWTAPRLKWILHATPGTARLARRNGATGLVSVLATHTFATHWRAVSVAGNKLLWQRTDTGQVSLWTVDQNGNYVRHLYLNPPGAGWTAVSIALEDDGACPAPLLPYRRYVVTFEGPTQVINNVIMKQAPILWTVDDNGALLGQETLPGASDLFTTLRDFRPARDGRWALLTAPTSFGSFGVAYYEKFAGTWYRLRTDRYSAAGGLTGCTLHPDGVGMTSCATSFVDLAAGSGFEPTSFQLAQDTASSQMGNTLLWTRSDGASMVFALDPLGQQTSPATTLTPIAAPYRAVSLGGWDESPGFPLLCDHRPPPIPGYP